MFKFLNWFDAQDSVFDKVPNSKGVYVISCRCKDKKYYVVYTGQSGDLQRRLKEHWSDNESNEELRKAISKYPNAFMASYAVVDEESDLDGCERFIYDYYDPQFTEKAPNVDPINCSLSKRVNKGRVNFQ